jgi:charged multivesicular body protein 1
MDRLIELKMAAQRLRSHARRCNKEQQQELGRLQDAIRKQNYELAQLYAQNAIRKRNENVMYTRLEHRIDAIYSKLQTAYTLKNATKSIEKSVSKIKVAVNSDDLNYVMNVMDDLEKVSDNMEVHAESIGNVVSNVTSMSTPQESVDELIQQVATQHGLDMAFAMPNTSMSSMVNASPIGSKASVTEDDSIASRLAMLQRNRT